jgi:hypothetical protein
MNTASDVVRLHHVAQQREKVDWGEGWIDSGYAFTRRTAPLCTRRR